MPNYSPAPVWGSSYRRQSSMNFSHVLSMVCNSQIRVGVTSPARTSTGSSLHRATDSARILFQSRLIDSIKHLPAPENLQSLWVDIFSSVYLHGLQRHSCLPMGCPRAAGESLLWLPEPSCPSSFTDPGGSAELFLPYILTPPYSPEAFTVAQLSFPFLNASSQK